MRQVDVATGYSIAIERHAGEAVSRVELLSLDDDFSQRLPRGVVLEQLRRRGARARGAGVGADEDMAAGIDRDALGLPGVRDRHEDLDVERRALLGEGGCGEGLPSATPDALP